MVNSAYLYSDITEIVIGSAMKVHNVLGAGFPEVVYQRALQIEFKVRSINYEREMDLPVFYGEHLVGRRRADFLIEGKVLLETKAVFNYEMARSSQMLNYLEIFRLPVGLLINFGKPRLEFKRYINNDPALKIL